MERYRKEAYEEGYHRGMQDCVDITFYMTIYTLSYKLELDVEELREISKAIFNNIDSFRTGHLEPKDYDSFCNFFRSILHLFYCFLGFFSSIRLKLI